MSTLPQLRQIERLEQSSAQELLKWAVSEFGSSLAIATAFQLEGMVIVDLAARISPHVRVLTLDTGRLPEETYRMIETVRDRYGIAVETVSPDSGEVEAMVSRPLERALSGLSAWVTGLRRDQNDSRVDVRKVEEIDGKLKLNPLADWTAGQVSDYIRQHDVPVHPLYAAGYSSIGCAPCTRAVQPGEDARAGRWWWEQDAAKECGFHFSPEGKAVRKLDVLLSEILEAKRA